MAEQKKRPSHEIRIRRVKAVIWRNEGSNGSWHNVTFERLYKDGDESKSSPSFGREDLLVVAKVANLVHTWMFENEERSES